MDTRPIRVCFPFLGRELGGSHFSSLGLIMSLDRTRFEPVILLQHLDGPIYDLFHTKSLPIVKTPEMATFSPGRAFSIADIIRAACAVSAATRALRRLHVDIVHCNDGRTSAVFALPAKLAGARLVWHNRGNPDAKGLRFVAPLLADRVVSVSEFASPRPGMYSARARNEVVYSPFDTTLEVDRKAARARLAEELQASEKAAFIGYFGALIDRKRPLLFVDAIAALRASRPEVDVIGLLFGDAYEGLDKAVLARAAEKGVADRIRLMGFRSPGSAWIAAVDILLVPAIEEPFGRTLIEAMVVGTPIVATRSGGNPEAISHGETGLLSEPESAQALAASMADLLASPAHANEIALNARRWARSNFGERIHAEAVMRIYDSVIA